MKERFLFKSALVLVSLTGLKGQPNWNVNPADYQFSANITAVLQVDYEAVGDAANMVGAFAGDTCRGVATPLFVMDTWMYFMTMYADEIGEEISFRAYYADTDTVLDVEEMIEFVPNEIYGDPTAPYVWNAILFFDHHPVVSGISDQTIEEGDNFTSFDLDDYFEEMDGDPIEWSYSGNQDLSINIDAGNVVTVSPPASDWVGSETVVFTATDLTANSYSGSDTAAFTVLPTDHPPQVGVIPDQTIGWGGQFTPIQLNEYLIEEDGDDVNWTYAFGVPTETDSFPDWSVQPADFEATMTVTARIISRGINTLGNEHILGAFADDECRGVVNAVNALGEWLYFLTVYANTNGENISFRFYDSEAIQILPVLEEKEFIANSESGTPENPFTLQAGNLLVDIDDALATVDYVDQTWDGSETVIFIAADSGTLNNYSDSTSTTFTVFPDHTPLVSGIADQTIEQGNAFQSFDLDDFLTEVDGDVIAWSYSGNSALTVTIDAENVVTVAPASPDWVGSETIVFTATDQTDLAFAGSDAATFTILPLDHPPEVADIPDQTIGLFGSFVSIELDDYLTELDGDSIIWSYDFQPPDTPDPDPGWSVQASAFELTMTVTARVESRGYDAQGSDHILAAFAGDEVRGVGSAVNALGEWLYFLTVYANSNGEEITFRFYDAETMQNLPVPEGVEFTANAVNGTPDNPFLLQAGHLLIDIDVEDQANINIVDPYWDGSETVMLTATDYGTLHNYSDSSAVTFTVLPDNTPLVVGIPDQTIEQGGVFQAFDLDDFLTEIDGDVIAWSYEGNEELEVNINAENVVTVTLSNSDWTGSEEITFTATDSTFNGFSSSDEALFTVLPLDHPPEVSDIPDQTAGLGGQFDPVYLDDYLTELDGDEISWSYAFAPPAEWQEAPDWSVQPQDYEYSMNLTGIITIRGDLSESESDVLGAFVGTECRGVTSPIFVMGQWMYFLTLYSNINGETIDFRVYHADYGDVVSAEEYVEFVSNAVIGSPDDPFLMNAGNIMINITEDHVAEITPVNSTWYGDELAYFIARDVGTPNEYADSALVTFIVLPLIPPVVEGLPDQTIDEGGSFAPFDLDDYLIQPADSLVTWSYSGQLELSVAINEGNVVTVTSPHPDWFGSEKIRFTATDISNPDLQGWDEVNFIVNSVNDAPVANAQSVTTDEDESLAITLTGNDADGDELTYLVVDSTLHGILSGTVPELSYSPAANFFGADSFTFKVSDWTLDSEPATVTIMVNPVNDVPIANAGEDQAVNSGDPVTLDGSASSDIDGDALIYQWTAPAEITLDDPTSVSPSFTAPSPSEDTDYIITLIVNDGNVDSDPDAVTISVSAVMATMAVEYFTGWNIVGLPLDVDNTFYRDLFPEAEFATLFSFGGTYQNEDSLELGIGYLLRLGAGGPTNFTGMSFDEITITVQEGWNIVSGISTPVLTEELYTSGVIMLFTVYGYNGAYFNPDTIEPGKGYWARSLTGGELVISSAITNAKVSPYVNRLEDANIIEFTDNDGHSTRLYFGTSVPENERLSYSLPPVFAGMEFDARFAGDWSYAEESGEIEVLNTSESLTISYNVVIEAAENKKWVLVNTVKGNEFELTGAGEIEVFGNADGFALKKEAIIPDKFTLYQNYPNPFNPLTQIGYSLPIDGFVELTVYNILGEKVTTLVSRNQKAGYQFITWDATDSFGQQVGAGLYFYRIRTEGLVQTNKMILLK